MEFIFLDTSPDAPYLDSLIYVGIILLILSQITEKIATYIRYYIGVLYPPNETTPQKRRDKTALQKITTWLLVQIAALDSVSDLAKNKPRVTPKEDKNRVEFAITKLSILVGFFIAFAFKADLFELMQTKGMPHRVLGWGPFDICLCCWDCWWNVIKVLPGCFATGFLLTFGSKFFHDLLELLYEVKRLRRKIADDYVYKAPDLDTMLQRLESKTDDPVRVVLLRHKEHLLHQFPNITSIARIFDNQGESYLEIRVSDDQLDDLKRYEFNYIEDGASKSLELWKIRWVTQAAAAQPVNGTLQTGNIYNRDNSGNRGKICFFAYKYIDGYKAPQPVLVTCFHILRLHTQPWYIDAKDNTEHTKVMALPANADPNNGFTEVGNLIIGLINEWTDCAVARLNEQFEFKNPEVNFSFAFSEIPAQPISKNTRVSIYGNDTPGKKWVANSCENAIRINYGEKIWGLNDLIYIEEETTSASDPSNVAVLAKPGDSGSLVIDDQSRAIGMVVAIDGTRTYALSLNHIVRSFKLLSEKKVPAQEPQLPVS